MNFNQNFSFEDMQNLVQENKNFRKTFRYFDSRNKDCFKNHFYHFILNDPNSIGYGHLDYDCGKMWLGMGVFDSYIGKGYGKLILKDLLNNRKNNILYLSVDKDNFKAINLYLQHGFRIYEQTKKIFYCIYK